MNRVDYWDFPGFENIYLEDSYLLSLVTNSQIDAHVEAVLRENHPLYIPPKPTEQYSYRHLIIRFPRVREFRWISKQMKPIRDPDGGVDYGNIDELYRLDGKYHMRGDWGHLEVTSDPPIVVYE